MYLNQFLPELEDRTSLVVRTLRRGADIGEFSPVLNAHQQLVELVCKPDGQQKVTPSPVRLTRARARQLAGSLERVSKELIACLSRSCRQCDREGEAFMAVVREVAEAIAELHLCEMSVCAPRTKAAGLPYFSRMAHCFSSASRSSPHPIEAHSASR